MAFWVTYNVSISIYFSSVREAGKEERQAPVNKYFWPRRDTSMPPVPLITAKFRRYHSLRQVQCGAHAWAQQRDLPWGVIPLFFNFRETTLGCDPQKSFREGTLSIWTTEQLLLTGISSIVSPHGDYDPRSTPLWVMVLHRWSRKGLNKNGQNDALGKQCGSGKIQERHWE